MPSKHDSPTAGRRRADDRRFGAGIAHLHRYVAAHGSSSPARHATIGDFPIGAWVDSRRTDYRLGRLSPERIQPHPRLDRRRQPTRLAHRHLPKAPDKPSTQLRTDCRAIWRPGHRQHQNRYSPTGLGPIPDPDDRRPTSTLTDDIAHVVVSLQTVVPGPATAGPGTELTPDVRGGKPSAAQRHRSDRRSHGG